MIDKILLLIPCYNCAPQIIRVLNQFNRADDSRQYFNEILLLDNQSKDKTLSSAVATAESISGVHITIGKNQNNYNLGGSHKVAFKYALDHNFTHVAVLHGDDQGNIRDLIHLLKLGRHRLSDACLGARFMRDSKLLGYSKFRIVGNHVFNGLFTLGTGTVISDLGSGLNIFGRKVIEDSKIFLYADDLRFNIYLLLGLLDKKLKIDYFPISWREDDQISNVKITSQALKTLQLLGQSIIQKKRFWMKDHRVVRYPAYAFDIVYKSW